MPSKFTKDGKKQTLSMELGPPGRILWLDDLSNRLEAQDGKDSQKEHSE